MDINGKDYIVMGELIIVPNTMKNDWFDIYVVKKGDNLYSIADNYNISLNDLLNINGLDKENYIYPGQEVLVPKDNVNIFITKDNDTLRSASDNLGLNLEMMLEQNDNIYLMPEQLLVYRK